MNKITVVTSTRAEYGLLSNLIKKLKKEEFFNIEVVATGSHLSSEFGMTINEIERDGVGVDKKIEILLASDTAIASSKAMGLALISFAEYFDESKPDALVVLGDRYETVAICLAAMNARVPIIHLHGGEATEGLVDEAVRNSITKLSYLHFTSTDIYRKRVIQMGENPSRVFNVGALGVENVLHTNLLSKEELVDKLDIKFDKFAILTFHPVTLENGTAEIQIKELLNAIVNYKDILFICTKANADVDGRVINRCIEEYSQKYTNIRLYDSLGMLKYLSAVKYSEFVIGNSSSGIIEVPSFGVPTINIGDRQTGRVQAESIINCLPEKKEIEFAINKALSPQFREYTKNVVNPNGDGETSAKIVNIIKKFILENRLSVKKKFYDI